MPLVLVLAVAKAGYQSSLASLKFAKATNIPIIILPNKSPAEKAAKYESIISPSIKCLNQFAMALSFPVAMSLYIDY
jgi:fructoselysine-6-P-deglycase FrlB-like protein